MTSQKTIRVTCERFDPSVDPAPREQSYVVPWIEGLSVLNVLTFIYENLDSGVGYYSCCGRGVCGRCTLTINGRAALACTSLAEGDLHLAPLRGKRVIRDLVVDL